tara:strand:+ start:1798 stop:2049 length:252 start_codon:yes stop_codon:yes gene_type:complete
MASFELVELAFDPADLTPTLEDEFTMTAVSKELESLENIDQVRTGAIQLLKIAMQRQAIIRGLCKRLAEIETQGVTRKKIPKG